MKVVAIFNRDGGTFRTADMDAVCEHAVQAFSSKGRQIECRPVAGADIETALQEAADEPDCDVILAGGGDGTISAAAAIAWKSGKTLAVLPAGTMNLYARTLGVPLDIYAGLDALASATPRKADIGTANGRPFVHQFSIGFPFADDQAARTRALDEPMVEAGRKHPRLRGRGLASARFRCQC